MRISDWSSDVCSSDLGNVVEHGVIASGAKQSSRAAELDCFVAKLLAMTESDVMLSWLHARPDGEVVRSAPRRHAAAGAAFKYLQPLAAPHQAEPRDRTAGMQPASAVAVDRMVRSGAR